MKKQHLLTVLMAFLLLIQIILPGFAAPRKETQTAETSAVESSPQTEATQATSQSDDEEQPVLPTGFELPAALKEYSFPTEDFSVRAKAAALIELNSHCIVYGYELDKRIYPASLTKIMTCMLALEFGNLDDTLTVSASALENLSEYGSTAGLVEGEQISVRELLYCIMVSSANEGANVIAEYISGSTEDFVALMNRKADELGMTSTHYANAHGLHNEDHYTTVRDLSVLATWAWQNPQFREFATTTTHIVPATNKSDERTLHTTNYLTSTEMENRYYYDKAKGVKTGFTTPAGACLISTASEGDLSFMSIVCGCEILIDNDGKDLDMRFVETKKLFEYGFEAFTHVQVLADTAMLDQPAVQNAEGRDHVVVHAKDNVTVLLPKDYKPEDITMQLHYDSVQTLQAPLERGERVGTVTAMYHEIELASCDLITLTAVRQAKKTQANTELTTPTQEMDGLLPGLLRYWYLTVPLLFFLLLFLVLLVIRAVNVRKAKQRAKKRRQQTAARRRNHE